jgi:hypothetical protein
MAEPQSRNEVGQTEYEDGTLERRKKSSIWAFYTINENDKSKAVCHTCNEHVSQGGKFTVILYCF